MTWELIVMTAVGVATRATGKTDQAYAIESPAIERLKRRLRSSAYVAKFKRK